MSEEIQETPKLKTYLLDTGREQMQIDIPDDWKVTYGPVTPGAKSYGGAEYALRIYETESKQRAIFTNVKSFRDLSIPVRRLVTSVEGSRSWSEDENRTLDNVEINRSSEWVEDLV